MPETAPRRALHSKRYAKKVPGLVVSKVLGHSKPSTTLDFYGHLIPVVQEDVAKLMNALFTPITVDMGETTDIRSRYSKKSL